MDNKVDVRGVQEMAQRVRGHALYVGVACLTPALKGSLSTDGSCYELNREKTPDWRDNTAEKAFTWYTADLGWILGTAVGYP